MKYRVFKIGLLVAVFSFVFLLSFSQAQAAKVKFEADTQLDLSGLPTTLYVKSGSECDQLTVSGSTLTVEVPAGSTFTLKTASYPVLALTPSGGSVTLTFDTTYFSTGYLSRWTAGSSVTSASVSFSVGVSETNVYYLVKVDGSELAYYKSSNGTVTFTYSGGFSTKTFTIERKDRPGTAWISPAADTTAPSISQIEVVTTATSATITWQTNESSLSWLVYGTTTDYGFEKKTESYLFSHSLVLTDLFPNTTYHYQIKSKDRAGNIGTYTDKTFTTLALGEVPEEIPEVPPPPPPPPPEKPITEMTIEELKAEITRITALITQIQSLLTKVPTKIEGIPAGFTFQKNLSLGMSDPDVVYLKIVLANQGCVSGLKNNQYFASKTLAGVKCLCQKYKTEISQAAGYQVQCTGFVGKGIRAKLNQLISR